MAGSRMLEALGCLCLLLLGVIANPVKLSAHFKPANNRLDCPAAHGTKYTGPHDGKWGVLCGWDTHSTEHHWPPITNLNFEQCIMECAKREECAIATFTGTCYLKKGLKGKGFIKTGRHNNRAAVNLHRFGDHDGKDDKAHKGNKHGKHGKHSKHKEPAGHTMN